MPKSNMGGKRAKAQPLAMTEQEYLNKKGVGAVSSGYTIDKLRGNRQLQTQRGRDRFEKEVLKANEDYQIKRDKAKAEYQELLNKGKVRDKTTIEKAIDTAKGNPDNASVQAARRILEKRGIDWKTGKPIKKKRKR